MDAKLCDRCRRYYLEEHRTAGTSYFDVMRFGQYLSQPRLVDLCLECFKKLQDWMTNPAHWLAKSATDTPNPHIPG